MRTTVEIPDELRERLVTEAARRHERGYSAVVARALRWYFANRSSDDGPGQAARRIRGSETRTADVDRSVRGSWRTAALSAIVVFELLAVVKDESRMANRRELIDLMKVLPVTQAIAERSAELFTALRRHRVTVDNEDLIIAATALTVSAPVLTGNRKHFEHIDGLTLA
jgi:predicted nucleic acid-binding protein